MAPRTIKVNTQLGYKSQAWFDANDTRVLLSGQTVYLEEPDTDNPTPPVFKRGDGINQLQNLIFNSAAFDGVQSVNGPTVDNTDPANPIVDVPLADEVPFTPSGNLVGPTVQDALEELDTEKETVANKDTANGYVGIDNWKIKFRNLLNTFTSYFENSNTASRTYTFQNRNGTIADDTDLAGKQPINAKLTDISGLGLAAGDFLYYDGANIVKKTTAQVKQLLNIDYKIVKHNINQSHTGSTVETLLPFFVEIDPAIVPITVNTRFYVEITSSSTASGNAKSLEMYIGPTSGTLVGATKVGHHSNPTVGAFTCNWSRTIRLLNSLTSMKFMNLGVGSTGRDDIQNMVADATSNAQNFANKVYFMFTVILANAADSRSLDGIKITISNPDITL